MLFNHSSTHLWTVCLLLLAQPLQGIAVSVMKTPRVCSEKNVTADEDANIIGGNCFDKHESCAHWALEGECLENDAYMLEACPCSCDSCPSFVDNEWDEEPQMAFGPLKEEIEYIIQKTEEYMEDYALYYMSKSTGIKTHICVNKHKGCSHWTLLGECEDNPGFMNEDCGPACQACHKSIKTE